MKRIFQAFAILATIGIVVTGCEAQGGSAADRAESANKAAQADIYARASAAVPVPGVSNFLARENLAEYLKRMDDPAKTWFVYEFGDSGAAIGYYVSRTYPQSICTFMTPPERIREHRVGGGSGPNPISVTTSPALDGVFYKGGGCETKFFFDLNSDAIIFTDNKTRASDAPLSVDAPLIKVEGPVSGKAGAGK